MANGKTNLMVTPAGWATYTKGEDTILFLRKKAAWTGLQTTAALLHGKFKVSMSDATNQANNAGLFKNVRSDPTLLGTKEQRALLTSKARSTPTHSSALVRQAVRTTGWRQGPFAMRNTKLAVALLIVIHHDAGRCLGLRRRSAHRRSHTPHGLSPTVPAPCPFTTISATSAWSTTLGIHEPGHLRQCGRQDPGRHRLHFLVQHPDFLFPRQRHRRFLADRPARHRLHQHHRIIGDAAWLRHLCHFR